MCTESCAECLVCFRFSLLSLVMECEAIAVAVFILAYGAYEIERRQAAAKKKKRVWAREWLLKREESGECLSLPQQELKLEDPYGYRTFLRMKATEFEEVLAMVAEDIRKEDTVMRMAIPPHQRLAVTLRYLATGETFRSLMLPTRISEHAIGKIVPEVCEAIVRRLGPIFVKPPIRSNEWLQIASGFETMWDYPLCLGALGGMHIVNRAPDYGGSRVSYKKQNSIVLMAIADTHYKFIYFDLGVNGAISDGGVWRNSSFYRTLEDKDLPPPCQLPGCTIPIPYHFIGDRAFTLSESLMKPYPERNENPARMYFNYRLSKARRVVEASFHILTTRFKVFQAAIKLDPANAEATCMAAIILHNFLVSRYGYSYLDFSSLDPVLPYEPLKSNIPRCTNMAIRIRNEMRDFFWRNRLEDEE